MNGDIRNDLPDRWSFILSYVRIITDLTSLLLISGKFILATFSSFGVGEGDGQMRGVY